MCFEQVVVQVDSYLSLLWPLREKSLEGERIEKEGACIHVILI